MAETTTVRLLDHSQHVNQNVKDMKPHQWSSPSELIQMIIIQWSSMTINDHHPLINDHQWSSTNLSAINSINVHDLSMIQVSICKSVAGSCHHGLCGLDSRHRFAAVHAEPGSTGGKDVTDFNQVESMMICKIIVFVCNSWYCWPHKTLQADLYIYIYVYILCVCLSLYLFW